ESPNLYAFCMNDPVNFVDVLGLQWVSAVQPDGSLVMAYNSGWFWPKYEGNISLGNVVTGPAQTYFSSNGSVGQSQPRYLDFSYDGKNYRAQYSAVVSAMANIPKDLSRQMREGSPSLRKDLFFHFLLTPVEASGGGKATVAGILDTTISSVAVATSFGNPMMNTHGSGGGFQHLMGVDSRDPSYLGITEWIEPIGNTGAAALLVGGSRIVSDQVGQRITYDFSVPLVVQAPYSLPQNSQSPSHLRAGQIHESQQLAQLGLLKNTSVWRPSQVDMESAAFKIIVGPPKFTQGGLPRGIIFDSVQGGFLEIKGGSSPLHSSYQLRLQMYHALKSGQGITIQTTRPVNPTFADWFLRWGGTTTSP
ncbi:MAG: hypothetical protein JJU05_00825, partial [Verrucomicrobia bacterium]|nr:hypothetical protein [Verrucomicrobiota bacterium]